MMPPLLTVAMTTVAVCACVLVATHMRTTVGKSVGSRSGEGKIQWRMEDHFATGAHFKFGVVRDYSTPDGSGNLAADLGPIAFAPGTATQHLRSGDTATLKMRVNTTRMDHSTAFAGSRRRVAGLQWRIAPPDAAGARKSPDKAGGRQLAMVVSSELVAPVASARDATVHTAQTQQPGWVRTRASRASARRAVCETVDAVRCVAFTDEGVFYNEGVCALWEGTPWCATATNAQQEYTTYGDCNMATCALPAATGQKKERDCLHCCPQQVEFSALLRQSLRAKALVGRAEHGQVQPFQ